LYTRFIMLGYHGRYQQQVVGVSLWK